ncbi:hypothetical protein [Phaeovulum sp.]|uniref:hypothetical protein n=1 Tax=Phaeovulum sp. TaxID=2934796 RepID=UPI003567B5A4
MNACTRNCWIGGAAAGVVVAVIRLTISHSGLATAVFLGLITFGLFGAFLVWAFCGRSEAASDAKPAAPARPAATAAPSGAATKAPTASAPSAPKPVAPAQAAPAAPKPAAPAQAAPAAPKPAAPTAPAAVAPAEAKSAPAAPVAPAAAEEEEAARRAARRAAKRARAAAQAEAAAKPEAAEKPAAAARRKGKGKADDLKAIKGIGPKFEKLLKANGIRTYAQIAAWGPQDIAELEAKLEGFAGRVERDGWVEQAKTLASGGATEFSKRVAEGDVYKDTE